MKWYFEHFRMLCSWNEYLLSKPLYSSFRSNAGN